jgi:site-specific DNA-methyltransferase (adenine-specific)
MKIGMLRNEAQQGDALKLLQSLPDGCTPLVHFDPQYRTNADKLKFGNEGVRQKGRFKLPQMADAYIHQCCREIARVLRPSGYLALWSDAFRLGTGNHLEVKNVLPCVDIIVWANGRFGMGKRSRRCGEFLLVLQKPPILASATWTDHGIRDRWIEKIEKADYDLHHHTKPIGLISRLIGAVTKPGDLVVDPAAGSFVVMKAAHAQGREFIGCDLAWGCHAEASLAEAAE